MPLDSPLLVTNKREIAHLLNSVIAERNLVHLSGLYSRALLTTALLGVDYQNELLYLDCSQLELVNEKILSDRVVGCRTTQAGVRLEFAGVITGLLNFQRGQAFVSEIPETITKLQRRDAFRLSLDTKAGAICRLLGGAGLTGKVLNLSVGGLAAEFSAQASPALFSPGELYGLGTVDIPGFGVFSIDLLARFTAPTTTSRSPKMKVGFEFIGLPNHLVVALQKYLINQERVALSSGPR